MARMSHLRDEVRQTGRTVHARPCAQAPGPGVILRAALEGFMQGSSRSWFISLKGHFWVQTELGGRRDWKQRDHSTGKR